MRFRFHNLNVIVCLRVKRIPFRGDTVTKQLTALFVGIPIQFMNPQNGAGNQLTVVGIECFEPIDDAYQPRKAR